MANLYSFKNIHNSTETKFPCEINGQAFDIENCSNARLIIMDNTEQIQIDDVDNCEVFIGACCSTIFIRNSRSSKFYICAKQIRLLQVENCQLFSLTPSEIHIELSSNIQVGSFVGGYEMHANNLKAANINPNNNLWYKVYDHNDIEKSHRNWSRLDIAACKPWFPDGSSSSVVMYTPPVDDNSMPTTGQVGESYGLEQMIRDANQGNNSIPTPLEQLDSNLAIMVCVYAQFGMDPVEKLTADGDNMVAMSDFESRLREISEVVGHHPDSSKEDIARALSPSSLRTVLGICGKRIGSSTKIDVKSFVDLCNLKAETMMMEEGDDDEEEGHDDLVQEIETAKPLEVAVCGNSRGMSAESPHRYANYDSFEHHNQQHHHLSRDEDTESSNSYANRIDRLAAEYLSGIHKHSDPNTIRPGSAPSGDILHNRSLPSSPSKSRVAMDSEVSKLIGPNCPYDDVFEDDVDVVRHDDAFGYDNDDDDDDDDDAQDNYHRNIGRVGHGREDDEDDDLEVSTIEYESRATRGVPIETKLPSAMCSPASARNNSPPRLTGNQTKQKSMGARSGPKPSESLDASRYAKASVTNAARGGPSRPQPRSTSVGRVSAGRIASAPMISSTSSTGIHETSGKELVLELVRGIVRQADLYHKVQVSLGFVDNYVMIPARGEIITSTPRSMISVRDIKAAFATCGLRLSDAQMICLVDLIRDFASSYKKTLEHSIVAAESAASVTVPQLNTVYSKDRLSSVWTKKFLSHIRLTSRAVSASNRARRSSTPSAAAVATGIATSATTISTKGAANPKPRPKSAGGRGQVASTVSTPATSTSMSPSRLRGVIHSSKAIGGHDIIADSEHDVHDEIAEEPPHLVPWEEWRAMKILESKKKKEEKPLEFKKALCGLPYDLTREELDQMLERYHIIPEDILAAEIKFRVDYWVCDYAGRRDFQYLLTLKSQAWEKKHSLKVKNLDKESKKGLFKQFKDELIKQKTKEIQESEQNSSALTKELFWKYEKMSTENRRGNSQQLLWGQWLKEHRRESDKKLRDLTVTLQDIKRATARKTATKKTMASFADIEEFLEKTSESLRRTMPSKSIELTKNLIALRKRVSNGGVNARGSLVSRAQFDSFFEQVLTSIDRNALNLEEKTRELLNEIVESYQVKSEAIPTNNDVLFFKSKRDAENRVIDNELSASNDQVFRKWLRKKEIQEKNTAKLEEDKKKERQAEELARKQQNAKAFNTWQKLYKKNQYISKMNNRMPRELPHKEKSSLTSSISWNKDTNLATYHQQQDKDI